MPGRGAASVARPLFKCLQQQVHRFAADGLPLTGVVSSPSFHQLLDPSAALRAAFEGAALSSEAATLDGEGWLLP